MTGNSDMIIYERIGVSFYELKEDITAAPTTYTILRAGCLPNILVSASV